MLSRQGHSAQQDVLQSHLVVHVPLQMAIEASRAKEVQAAVVNQPLAQQPHLVALLSRQQAAAEEEEEGAVSQRSRPSAGHHDICSTH